MTGMPRTHLAALIGSRICHDLGSPLGAITNGLELLSMTGLGDLPEAGLIRESVAAATARLRFYRVAFGVADSEGILGRREIAMILDEMYAGGRLMVLWHVPGDLDRASARMAFLGLLCLEAALPRGGTVEVRRDLGDDSWQLSGSGITIRADPPGWAVLQGCGMEAPGPEMVQFLLLAEAAAAEKRPLRAEAGPDGVVISY
ncbi:MAG: histidine phosphotransferase [Rhodobacteraceae bacterium]|nr:histidine phosphotransferase [Paracoccaceae bacterium]